MELAKKFLFKLDSKSVKVLRDKSFVCYNTDTIKLVIEIIENDDYKDLYDSRIEVIYSYPNGESKPIKQVMDDGGIVVEDDSLISIIPKSGCLLPTEYMKVDINIYDDDEFISLQPFAFKIYKSMENEIFEEAQDVVNTMKNINEQMKDLADRVDLLQARLDEESTNINNQLNTMVQNINSEIADLSREISATSENLEERVNEAISNANTTIVDFILEGNNRIDDFINTSDAKLKEFLDVSNNEVNGLMDKINNTNIELDECFLRSTPLAPIDISGKLLFSTDILLTSPTNLVNKSYILTTSGSPYTSTVITSNIGFLYFTLENGNVVINYSPIANKSVQGNSISVVPQFNNGKNSIESSASGYKIYVLTNLLTSCVDNATCTITSNTTLSNNI